MSEIMEKAVALLNEKMAGGFDGSARIEITGHGTIVVDGSGVRVADDPTEVTLRADADTFQELLSGDLDPTSAFMSGRLEVEGDVSQAIAFGTALS